MSRTFVGCHRRGRFSCGHCPSVVGIVVGGGRGGDGGGDGGLPPLAAAAAVGPRARGGGMVLSMKTSVDIDCNTVYVVYKLIVTNI